MKSFFCNILFLLILHFANAQDARDSIIGRYNVQRQYDGAGTIWWDTLVISKDLGHSNQIFIWYVSDGGGTYHVFNSIDHSFYEPYDSLDYGGFYGDSIFVRRWLYNSHAPFICRYWGFKAPAITTTVNEINNIKDHFTICPNPASTFIHISSDIHYSVIKITDLLGNIVKQKDTGTENTEMDVSDLPNGIYFVSVKTKEGILTKKIIVQK